MKRTILNRSAGLATLALTASLSLSACGSEDTGSASDESSPSETTSESASETPSEEPTESEEPAATAGTEPFGEACGAVPADGEGSMQGMADDPVATAASNNPLLKTLVAAVTEAGLVDTLNSAEGITVFAPTDDAFAKIPKKTMGKVMADKETLTAILTHHVVGETITPDMLADGTFQTLNNDELTTQGSGEKFTADAEEKANIICGNIQTANATVYVIDTVMMPQM